MKTSILKSRIGNVVEGPMGLRMPESIARKIEAVRKSLPRDFTYRRHAITAKSFQPDAADSRAEVSYITTDAVDRDEEVYLPAGGDWSTFNKSVMWCHTYVPENGWCGLPVGSCLWMKNVPTNEFNGTLAKTRYSNRPEDWQGPWLPDAIIAMQRSDPPACTGKSIGVQPLNVRDATNEELRRHPEWRGLPIIDKWMGLEYSACPIPVNQTCEMQAVSKSLSGELSKTYIAAMNAAYKGKAMEPAQKDMGGDGGMDEMSVNVPAVEKCKALIDGDCIHDSSWDDSDPAGDGSMCIGKMENPGGLTTHHYPVGKAKDDGVYVHRKALEKCMTKSLAFGHTDVHEAAKMLHGKMVERDARNLQLANTKAIHEYGRVRAKQLMATIPAMVAAKFTDQLHKLRGTP
jgi:hypothetical protein